MTRRRLRYVVRPSTGRAASLGMRDPRHRRDQPPTTEERVANTDDPRATGETVVNRVVATTGVSAGVLESQIGGVDIGQVADNFTFGYGGTDYLYVSSQDTPTSWRAWRSNADGESQTSGSGSAPDTLSQFEALSWPAP